MLQQSACAACHAAHYQCCQALHAGVDVVLVHIGGDMALQQCAWCARGVLLLLSLPLLALHVLCWQAMARDVAVCVLHYTVPHNSRCSTAWYATAVAGSRSCVCSFQRVVACSVCGFLTPVTLQLQLALCVAPLPLLSWSIVASSLRA
jgi:hypothetical protein